MIIFFAVVKILKSSMLLIRITLACCCVSQKTVDSLLCKFIEKIIQYGLEESRLASLIELIQSKKSRNWKYRIKFNFSFSVNRISIYQYKAGAIAS